MYPYRYGKEPVRNQVVIQRVCLLLVVPPAAHPLPSGTQSPENEHRGTRAVVWSPLACPISDCRHTTTGTTS